jgi:hypothetical protein
MNSSLQVHSPLAYVPGSREDIVAASIQRSPLWKHMQVLRLTRNMRLEQSHENQEFAQWLLDIGHARNSDTDGMVALPDRMVTHNLDTLISNVYGGISSNSQGPPPSEYFQHRTILAPRNHDVDQINHEILTQMPGDEKIYFSADQVIYEEGVDGNTVPHGVHDQYPVEFLRSLDAAGLPLGELSLKVGCPLILLRNLAPAQGLCNGTRMVLLRASQRVLEVKIIGGDYDGHTAFIPRISLTPSSKTADFSFILKRRQFPIRLAFAMTINKAQGQSVKFVGLDLRTPVFGHGQLYVALSRVTSSHNIKVLLPPGMSKTQNIVYPEVLIWFDHFAFTVELF